MVRFILHTPGNNMLSAGHAYSYGGHDNSVDLPKNAGHDTIFVLEDAFPPDFCDEIVRFINDKDSLLSFKGYKNGNNVICDALMLSDFRDSEDARILDQKIASALGSAVERLVHTTLSKIMDNSVLPLQQYVDTGYELRRVRGDTRLHNDNLEVKIVNGKIRFRIASVCVCLSDCGDTITFPVQNKTVQYKKGMMVLFPTVWTYPHFTTYADAPNYRLQTWLANDKAL